MTTKIKIGENKIFFSVENDFIDEKEEIILSHRYVILLRDRWSLLYFALTRYFIKNGRKGCYIGERYDSDGSTYDIYDLTKIFPNTKFKENDFSFLRETKR